MKKLIILIGLLSYHVAEAKYESDTTIIEFNDKTSNTKVKVIENSNKTIELPKILNLNNILKAVGVDSSEREKAIVLVTKGANGSKSDTVLVVSQEGSRIKIVTRERAVAVQDTTIREAQIEKEERIESFEEEDEDGNYENYQNPKPKKEKKFFPRSDFAIYFGINNFVNGTPGQPNMQYNLRDFRSRYVALSFRKNATLVKGNKVDLAFSYGPEIAWYNFMLENSNLAVYDGKQVSFVDNTKPTQKSKLVMPYINLPLMLNLGFKEDKFKLGFGGYVGYRVGGYSKEKYVSGGKNKVKGDFGFNDVIYGLTTEFGKRNGLTFFMRYDLNKLFKDNQVYAKDLQAFSVGLRL
jgi:hypothetical protein